MDPERISASGINRIRLLLEPLDPKLIYLFGSTATGLDRTDSDIDLAVLAGTTEDECFWFELGNQLAGELGRQVDLVNLSHASTVMAKEVLRTGILIQAPDPALRQNYEMRVLSDYARLNEERREMLP